MSVTPLPVWSGYVILAAMGACSIGLVLLMRKVRGKANDVSWLRHGRRQL